MKRLSALPAALALLLLAPTPPAWGAHAPPVREPTPEELRSADAALDTVREVCARTLGAVLGELRVRYPGLSARLSGDRSRANDYRNYQWISVKFGEREYLLTAHHNNLDVRTGNPHTQYGRIQFWRCAGPNGPHERDAGGTWRFRADREWRDLPRLRVWDEDFSATRVADLFEKFLTECGEGEELAALAAARDPAAAPPPDVPLADRRKADEALETLRAVESAAMAAVAQELRVRHPDWKIRQARGNSRVNDYRNYQWIVVAAGAETFFVCMCYNDLDPNTGNTHTQYGRIQFWRGVHHENGPNNEAGPHTRDEGGWVFRADKQWADLPRLHLWSPDYSSARVADLFETFVAER